MSPAEQICRGVLAPASLKDLHHLFDDLNLKDVYVCE